MTDSLAVTQLKQRWYTDYNIPHQYRSMWDQVTTLVDPAYLDAKGAAEGFPPGFWVGWAEWDFSADNPSPTQGHITVRYTDYVTDPDCISTFAHECAHLAFSTLSEVEQQDFTARFRAIVAARSDHYINFLIDNQYFDDAPLSNGADYTVNGTVEPYAIIYGELMYAPSDTGIPLPLLPFYPYLLMTGSPLGDQVNGKFNLITGKKYEAFVSVHNSSTDDQNEQPVGAKLTIRFTAVAGTSNLINTEDNFTPTTKDVEFAADETKVFGYALYIPTNPNSLVGTISAKIISPVEDERTQIAEVYAAINIQAVGKVFITAEDIITGDPLAEVFIFIDDDSTPIALDVTGYEFTTTAGLHKIRAIKTGYDTLETLDENGLPNINVDPGAGYNGTEPVTVHMKMIESVATVNIKVTNIDDNDDIIIGGAQVYLDGVYKGNSNMGIVSIARVTVGLHGVQVEMEGYQNFSTVITIVSGGGIIEVPAQLTKMLGWLGISSIPMRARVSVDNVDLGNAPSIEYLVASDTPHTIRATLLGYQDFIQENVIVGAGGALPVVCTMIKAPGQATYYPSPIDRINAAKLYLDTMYQTDGTYGYMSEYPGMPLRIHVRDTNDDRLLGWDKRTGYETLIPIAVSQLGELIVKPSYDSCVVAFDDKFPDILKPLADYKQPVLKFSRSYTSNGMVTCKIQLLQFNGTYVSDLYFKDLLVISNIGASQPVFTLPLTAGTTQFIYTGPDGLAGDILASIRQYSKNENWSLLNLPVDGSSWPEYVYADGMMYQGNLYRINVPQDCTIVYYQPVVVTYQGSVPASRYTVRHGSRFGQWINEIWGFTTKVNRLKALRDAKGFSFDVYDPMFGKSVEQADDFMFDGQAYADTWSVWLNLPKGINPSHYPYLSKITVGGLASQQAYILYSRSDPLLQALQAIHILNKYGDPNHSYNFTTYGSSNPQSVANDLMDKWNGIGIASPRTEPQYASAIRTAAFFVLVTLLGYRYNLANFRTMADTVYTAISSDTGCQAGQYPLDANYVVTNNNGVILRPQYNGSFYNVYERLVKTDSAGDHYFSAAVGYEAHEGSEANE
jgi:hypothetical protein